LRGLSAGGKTGPVIGGASCIPAKAGSLLWDKIIAALLVIAGIIHLLPVSGVLGAPRLQALYGLAIDDPNLLILMRHRAVLFGIVGLLLIGAAFKAGWQTPAIAAGLISVIGFLILAKMAESPNAEIQRVVLVDWVALAALIGALVLKLLPAIRGGAQT